MNGSLMCLDQSIQKAGPDSARIEPIESKCFLAQRVARKT